MILLLACIDPTCEQGGSPGTSGTLPLTPEVVQAGQTPVRRVTWTTPEPSTGVVNFGVGDLSLTVADNEFGTTHDLFVGGIPTGADWQLQAVSESETQRWTSDVIPIDAAPPPPNLTLPSVTVAGDASILGYEFYPMPGLGGGMITMLDVNAAPVWWAPTITQATYRARYDAETQTAGWVESQVDGSNPTFVASTLDFAETRVPAPTNIHHDFAMTVDGGFIALVFDEREVDGQTIRGESLQEISVDGSVREIWNAWNAWNYPGGGKRNEDGTIEWPHANSIDYDPERRKIFVSLLYLDAVAEIDQDSGSLEWLFGGDLSDWEISGAGFAGQHGPMSFDGGNGLALLNNGAPGLGEEAAVAMVYTLDSDARSATPQLTFDDAAAHTGVILGNVEWVGDGSITVNWGSAGVLSRANAAGEKTWEVSFPLGTFPMFSQHVADFGGGIYSASEISP